LCDLSFNFSKPAGAQVTDKKPTNSRILEVAILDIIPGKTDEFQAIFETARQIISSIKGWLGHQLQ
jgi:hypothetical protein